MKIVSFLILGLALVGCSAIRRDSLYERHIGQHRGYYDSLLVDRAAYTQGRSYHHQLVDAIRDDTTAAHQLFHNEHREDGGEYGETWALHCYVLLLKLGDRRFASLLAADDEHTQEIVGGTIDGLIYGFADEFPMTRSLYKTRWQPPHCSSPLRLLLAQEPRRASPVADFFTLGLARAISA
jgi:hypothetical protein